MKSKSQAHLGPADDTQGPAVVTTVPGTGTAGPWSRAAESTVGNLGVVICTSLANMGCALQVENTRTALRMDIDCLGCP